MSFTAADMLQAAGLRPGAPGDDLFRAEGRLPVAMRQALYRVMYARNTGRITGTTELAMRRLRAGHVAKLAVETARLGSVTDVTRYLNRRLDPDYRRMEKQKSAKASDPAHEVELVARALRRLVPVWESQSQKTNDPKAQYQMGRDVASICVALHRRLAGSDDNYIVKGVNRKLASAISHARGGNFHMALRELAPIARLRM